MESNFGFVQRKGHLFDNYTRKLTEKQTQTSQTTTIIIIVKNCLKNRTEDEERKQDMEIDAIKLHREIASLYIKRNRHQYKQKEKEK